MRLSWNEIRVRAAAFADEWKNAHYEKGETHTFYNEFFEVFGVTRRRVASFEEPIRRLDQRYGFIDLFWKGVLLVEQKSAGGNLTKAKAQALDYFPGLKEAELPRHVLVSDFQNFELYDLDEEVEPQKFRLADLHKHVEHFGFILGVEKRTFRDQDPVNIQASELMGKLHDTLQASGYRGHELEQFLVRVLFCLFADDTGIFEPRDIFLALLEERTQEDGSDTGLWIGKLFEVLNTPENARQTTLDEDLKRFPNVNGALFKERLQPPAFDAQMRKVLLEACRFSWDAISPAIFGALFQAVMEPEERRAQGAHYTTEKNILKVIRPLFLDDLWAEFDRIRARQTGRKAALEAFHTKLSQLRFFDPACGCGNFLVITYRELRDLEIALLKELNPKGQRVLDVALLSKLNVNQFYGIEINEFPARIAEVALWMMDHIMNNHLSIAFGETYARIPLKVSPHIHHADAVEIDWNSVIPASECSYVFGNPPFGGFVFRDKARQAQMAELQELVGSAGRIDYVVAWFFKAGEYVQHGAAAVAFVATNSITQGEQVAQVWPILFERFGLEIAFAHRTFAWGSDARGVAHVHVVVIGLTKRDQEVSAKRLFSYENARGDPVESSHRALSPYLFDASKLSDRHLVVVRSRTPLNGLPSICVGSKPVDGGHYIFDAAERETFLAREPTAAPILRPYVGSREYINNEMRWILYPPGLPVQELRRLPAVMERIAAVREHRRTAEGNLSRELADKPTEYHVTVIPTGPFLAIPEVSSERREYIPIGWLEPPTIPSNKLLIIPNGSLDLFALLVSKMHMAWVAYIGGRLKSDFQYSGGVVYNTFPVPERDDRSRRMLASAAQEILQQRAKHPGASLADLYDRDLMPAELRRAHRALDAVVEGLYRRPPFESDRDRVEHLFMLYEQMVRPLTAPPIGRRRRAA